MLLKIALGLVIIHHLTFADDDWGYIPRTNPPMLDPDHWYQKYQNCIGNRQSPIDIEKDYVVYDPTLEPLIFIGYDRLINSVNITNEGHTVRVSLPEYSTAYVTSRSLNTTYKLKQIHFHWGHDDSVGSEHVLFGQHFPLEMHLVHADEAVSYDKALLESFGLLAVSVLFKFGTANSELQRITNHFPLISDPLKKTISKLQSLNLKTLIPTNAKNYLQYAGSLTTPPCNEAVKWIVLTENQQLSHAQMTYFRNLKHEIVVNGQIIKEQIETNDRVLQDIKDRKVSLYYAFDNVGPV